MPKVTLSPDMLFLSTWDAPERVYMHGLLTKLKADGCKYYVEPIAGAFAMPTVAVAAGWEPNQIHTSDVSLYANVVGIMLSGGNLEELAVTHDGALVEVAGLEPTKQAAIILWTQLLARLEHRAQQAIYWHEAVADLYVGRRRHIASIERGLQGMLDRLQGIGHDPEDIWDTVNSVSGKTDVVVVCNPPTYKNGYEKFFDTGGRLRWNEVKYEIWEPGPDQTKLAKAAEESDALFVIQQQTKPRSCAGEPVYARHLSPGQYVYLWSNQPDRVKELMGGLKVKPRSASDIAPFGAPDLEVDHEFSEDSVVSIEVCSQGTAAWYKQRWLHRLAGAEGAYNFLVLVDGRVAGVAGYSFKAIQTPYPGVDDKIWAGATIMRFALGAPHEDHRVTRLITRLALQRQTLLHVAKTMPSVMLMAAGSDKIVTTEYTRHPESKGLRGLMKLADRTKDDLDGFRLVYWSPIGTAEVQESYDTWLADEARYIEKRSVKA